MVARQISGWVWDANVRTALEHVSLWIGYEFDSSDWQAIELALPNTSNEFPENWYDYPLVGTPVLTVLLARDPNADPVEIQVSGDIDDILAARIETLFGVLCDIVASS